MPDGLATFQAFFLCLCIWTIFVFSREPEEHVLHVQVPGEQAVGQAGGVSSLGFVEKGQVKIDPRSVKAKAGWQETDTDMK